MEIFRRLGVAGKLRNAGLPADYPNDVAYRTTFDRPRAHAASRSPAAATATRHRRRRTSAGRHPSRRTASTRSSSSRSWATTPTQAPRLTVVHRAERPPTSRRSEATASRRSWRDLDSGGRPRSPAALPGRLRRRPSLVRKHDRRHLRRRRRAAAQPVDVHLRAPDLLARSAARAGVGDVLAQPAPLGQRLRHRRPRALRRPQLPAGRRDRFDGVDRDCVDPHDPRRRARLPLRGASARRTGIGRRLIADRFRDRPHVPLRRRRAHLGALRRLRHERRHRRCHQPGLACSPPTSPAGPPPPSSTPTRSSAGRSPSRSRASRWTTPRDGPAAAGRAGDDRGRRAPGDAARARARPAGLRAERAAVLLRRASTSASSTTRSPLIADDGEAAPPYTMGDVHAVDGARLPHAPRLAGRRHARSTTRSARTTRCCGSTPPSTWPAGGARPRRALPLTVLDVAAGLAPAEYRHALVLSRPDQHVAWRGDACRRRPKP